MKCPYCDSKMRYLKTDQIQLGKYGFLMGHLAHLFSGAIPVHIYVCPTCGKLEFFMPQKDLGPAIEKLDKIPLKTCPDCLFDHDERAWECPNCGHKYPENDY